VSRVVIIGQGYVGLPLAVAAAEAGHDVVGFDLDAARVDELNAGTSHITDISSDELAAVIAGGRYRASADPSVVRDADVVVICVPTPYHNDAPDLSYIEAAGATIGAHLAPGTLVILESTTYPGTTEELLQPILEQASGLRAGDDFHLVFSPERIDPGNPKFGLRNTPKIVGGMTPAGSDAAAAFYGTFVDRVIPVSRPAAAEMAKLLENTFRHINIALVNELAILCQDLGIDVWEVIDAAASKPFGFMAFYPGPGVGGHCIPVDPMYLSWRVKQFGGAAKFIELARDVNDAMPLYCVSRVQDLLNDRERSIKGSRIVVIGVAYKSGISDLRESPSLVVLDALRARGANVSFHDPHVGTVRMPDGGEMRSVELDDELLSAADCVVILTAHPEVDHDAVVAKSRLVFDTRNVTSKAPHVHRL
jgi:UDP-N-acetyl-D-glucosamine dehydrogenase